jgi:hypothetical protein
MRRIIACGSSSHTPSQKIQITAHGPNEEPENQPIGHKLMSQFNAERVILGLTGLCLLIFTFVVVVLVVSDKYPDHPIPISTSRSNLQDNGTISPETSIPPKESSPGAPAPEVLTAQNAERQAQTVKNPLSEARGPVAPARVNPDSSSQVVSQLASQLHVPPKEIRSRAHPEWNDIKKYPDLFVELQESCAPFPAEKVSECWYQERESYDWSLAQKKRFPKERFPELSAKRKTCWENNEHEVLRYTKFKKCVLGE